MTDTQVKYQTLMENQRHNLEMERIGAQEADVKKTEAQTKHWQAQQNYAFGIYDRAANILPTLFGMAETGSKSYANIGSGTKSAFQAFGSLFS